MTPHTPEWFTATTRTNPDIAEAAHRNILYAGHTNVCSICGDRPEGDFVYMGGSLFLRLCASCKQLCDEAYEGINSAPMAKTT